MSRFPIQCANCLTALDLPLALMFSEVPIAIERLGMKSKGTTLAAGSNRTGLERNK